MEGGRNKRVEPEFLGKCNKWEGSEYTGDWLEFLGKEGANVSTLSTKDHPNWK